jgi:hypothetical protein
MTRSHWGYCDAQMQAFVLFRPVAFFYPRKSLLRDLEPTATRPAAMRNPALRFRAIWVLAHHQVIGESMCYSEP